MFSLTQKPQKRDSLGQNSEKMTVKILVEIFFVVIDSGCFKTYFKSKISKSKNFSHVKFFPGTLSFLTKIVKKKTKSKKFGRKFFWSESIQNGLKRILKRKS